MIGVVLAGGRSLRLGEDKSLALLGDRTLTERAVDRLRPLVEEILVADRGRRTVNGAVSVPEAGDRGPAGGILAAAAARPGAPLLVLACDLPFVPAALLDRLRRGAADHDLVVPVTGRGPEPAVSAWSRRAVETLESRVAAGSYALRALLDGGGLSIERIPPAELRGFGDPERMFLNVNRPGDLRRARELLGPPPRDR